MLSFFRRASKSKVGTWVIAAVLLAILAGFVVADLSNVGTGSIGFGTSSTNVATVGNQQISDRDMSDAMQRRLQEVRQQQPEADYAAIMGDFEAILNALIDQRALIAFANKFDFHLSKRLIDAEIAQIPQARGLDGRFSEQAYQGFLAQQRLTDAQVRQIIAGSLLQRLMLTPIATNARVSVGMATPYASMMLESREGEAAAVPIGAFRGAFKPTDADLQRYYAANRNRYMIPEQRVLRFARIGPEQVANVTASDQEIAAYYNANRAAYAARDMRSLTQVVVPDRATANGIAARAKGGTALTAAAAPAGANAAVSSLKDQSREAYAGVAGNAVAAAVFAAPSGAIVGPVQSEFGWVVVKVDSVKAQGGRSLEQARGEIAARLNTEKRKQTLEDLVTRIQDSIDDGSNFVEAAGSAKLPVTTTPLILANGTSRVDAGYKAPQELAAALKAGFEIAPNDPPEIVSIGADRGYVLVAPAQVVSAAPAPLATVRDRVASDWIDGQAIRRARAVATAIAAKTARGTPLAQAVREAGGALPPVRPLASRRIQIATAQGPVPPPLQMLFTLAEGKSRMIPDRQGRGFYVVKVNKIVPGNALLQPGLIGRMQTELRQAVAEDYAMQFVAAIREEMKAKRNEDVIRALKSRMSTGVN